MDFHLSDGGGGGGGGGGGNEYCLIFIMRVPIPGKSVFMLSQALVAVKPVIDMWKYISQIHKNTS